MLSLHTNSAALSAQNSITRNQSSLSTSMTRLSTGFRINSAMDDAAGLQIATRLKAQTSGMAMAMRNTQNAISMMQTAEGALGETSNILIRMKDLATQSADASSTASDKTAMQSEYDALSSELSNIIGNTSFGGAKLLNKAADATAKSVAATASTADAAASATATSTAASSLADYNTAAATFTSTPNQTNADNMEAKRVIMETDAAAAAAAAAKSTASTAYNTAAQASTTSGKFSAALDFQIGASTSEKMGLDLSAALTTVHANLGATSVNYNSFGAALGQKGTELTTNASLTIDKLSTAIDSIGGVRSALGAAANRLEHVATNLSNVSSNTEAAAGRIMDVDFATESSAMTSNQMLLQAGTAMLKQSNSMSSMVMSLLQ